MKKAYQRHFYILVSLGLFLSAGPIRAAEVRGDLHVSARVVDRCAIKLADRYMGKRLASGQALPLPQINCGNQTASALERHLLRRTGEAAFEVIPVAEIHEHSQQSFNAGHNWLPASDQGSDTRAGRPKWFVQPVNNDYRSYYVVTIAY